MTGLFWWGYLHANGHIILKRRACDHNDYTMDREHNSFVSLVVPPFQANTREDAAKTLERLLIDMAKVKKC